MKNLFSCLLAVLLSVALSVLFGAILVPLLAKLKFGQNILKYVKEHDSKKGTPTMGGLIFLLSSFLVLFIVGKGDFYLAVVCMTVGAGYAAVGMIDDGIKIAKKRNEGLDPLQKTLFETAIAVVIALFCCKRGLTRIFLPFSGNTADLGLWFFPLCILVFLATTNSVNLTDGLDGLAAGVCYLYFAFLGVTILLLLYRSPETFVFEREYENLALLCFSLVGGLVGYLLFNTSKASVFMGDTGSLALGGLVAATSIVSGNLLFIPVVGIMFVCSSLSVILQVLHFRRTGKRIFLMAPLHHHFQHLGYSESKIAFGYKLVTFVAGAIYLLITLAAG